MPIFGKAELGKEKILKNLTRSYMLNMRKKLQEKEKLDFALAQQVLAWQKFKNARKIFLFHSLPEEPNTLPIYDYAMKHGKKCALPKILNLKNGIMEFYYCDSPADLQAGPFGLLEPGASCPRASDDPDLILVPGLAFDRSGCRLGYGKGFYDRYFAHLDLKNCLLAGVSYSFQVLDKVPVEKTDVPVDYICTNDEIIEI